MTKRREASPSQEEFSSQSKPNQKERGGAYKESNANNPLIPLVQEQQNWYDWCERPHEELVKGFKDYVQEWVQRSEGHWSPEELIRSKLDWHESSLNKEEVKLFFPVGLAWDALVYDRYKPDSRVEIMAGALLEDYYKYLDESAIKLSDPQIRIIDALAEAVGIPHERGLAEIEIPDKLRHYRKWHMSKEYVERLKRHK